MEGGREGGHLEDSRVGRRHSFVHSFIHVLMMPACSVQHVLVLGPRQERAPSSALLELIA